VLIESVLLKNGIKKLLAKKTLERLYNTNLWAIDRLRTELVAFRSQLVSRVSDFLDRWSLHEFAVGAFAFLFKKGYEAET